MYPFIKGMKHGYANERGVLLKAGYSAKAVKFYMNKVSAGSNDDPDVSVTHTGLPCGDAKLYLKLGENNLIKEAKFEDPGCVGTTCSGSALTMLIISKTVEEAWEITADDVLKELGGLRETHARNLLFKLCIKLLKNSRFACRKSRHEASGSII